MKKRDPNAAQRHAWRLRRVAKRCPFKLCRCGEYTVFEAYVPASTGWDYWCYTCGRKDEAVFEVPQCIRCNVPITSKSDRRWSRQMGVNGDLCINCIGKVLAAVRQREYEPEVLRRREEN